jgi:hypothetical protein
MGIVAQMWFNGSGTEPRLGIGPGGQDAILGNNEGNRYAPH